MNSSLLIPLMFVAAAVCGAAWSIVPAIARVYLNVNEIISTLMFNFIAVSWVIYWAGSKWGEQASAGSVKSESVPEQTILESIPVGDYLIPISFVFAFIFGGLVWLFLRGSVFGYEMSIIGSSPKAATYAGMPTKRIMLIVFALGGVAAGLAGVTEMLTNVQLRPGPLQQHRLHRGGGGCARGRLRPAAPGDGARVRDHLHRRQCAHDHRGAERTGLRHVWTDPDLCGDRPGPAPRASSTRAAPSGRRRCRASRGAPNEVTVRIGLHRDRDHGGEMPVLIAATGELLAEIVGIYNIGIEGAMLISPGAFIGVQQTDAVLLGILAGMIAGALRLASPSRSSSSKRMWWSAVSPSSSSASG